MDGDGWISTGAIRPWCMYWYAGALFTLEPNLPYLTLPMIRVPSDSSYLLPAGRMLTYPRLMLAVGAGGFITFILKTGKGGLTPLPPLSSLLLTLWGGGNTCGETRAGRNWIIGV